MPLVPKTTGKDRTEEKTIFVFKIQLNFSSHELLLEMFQQLKD